MLQVDYSFFSDVVCFDTTYKTNGYDLPYAPFGGVNHHGQSMLFGCGLLLDETIESFKWLFKAFLQAMKSKQPKTIFTDQAQAIGNPIVSVFLDAHHRLCLWHINLNAAKNLSHVFDKFTSFAKSFSSCIYNNETEEQFDSCWNMLLKEYGLEKNSWLLNLYKLRKKWALVFVREYFCAGITTTQRSESMNSYFKKYYKRTMLLREFVAKYEESVLDQREQEISEDFDSRQTSPILKSRWKVEEEATGKYTRTIFKHFQHQLLECLNYFEEQIEEDGTIFTYKVSSFGAGNQRVTFDSSDSSVHCSCKMFEFVGILCPHALKVLQRRQLSSIPQQYYLHKWIKYATSGLVIDESKTVEVGSKTSLASRYNELAHIALAYVVKAATTLQSYELGKEELMILLRKMDQCLQISDHGLFGKIASTHEESGDSHVENNIMLKDPSRKKNKDHKYGRIKQH